MMNARVVHTIAGEAGRSWGAPVTCTHSSSRGEESGGSLFALDCLVGAGAGRSPHRHLAEDELFTITEERAPTARICAHCHLPSLRSPRRADKSRDDSLARSCRVRRFGGRVAARRLAGIAAKRASIAEP